MGRMALSRWVWNSWYGGGCVGYEYVVVPSVGMFHNYVVGRFKRNGRILDV